MTKDDYKLLCDLNKKNEFPKINSKEFESLFQNDYIECTSPSPDNMGGYIPNNIFRVSKYGKEEIKNYKTNRRIISKSNTAIYISLAALLISLLTNIDKIIKNIISFLKLIGLMH